MQDARSCYVLCGLDCIFVDYKLALESAQMFLLYVFPSVMFMCLEQAGVDANEDICLEYEGERCKKEHDSVWTCENIPYVFF